MLEAFQSLQDKFSSFLKTSKQPEVEVDQTSASASKPGPSNQAVTLDPPPPRPRPTSHSVDAMEVDHVSVLINLNMTTHWISIQVYPMNLLGWHRLGLKSILTLIKSRRLNRGPPQISIQVNPMSLGLHHLDLKNMQIEANTK